MTSLKDNDRVLVTGASGLIGTNLVNALKDAGYDAHGTGSKPYDFRDIDQVRKAFDYYKPTALVHMAARVGGIYANSTQKAGFYSDNVLINTNTINTAVDHGIEYVFAMGTGCAYPKRLEEEMLFEADFLDGIPEETNDAYAYAKRGMLVHLKALQETGTLNYTYCLPANIYGPHDNFHPMHSHVVPGLIRRFSDAAAEKADELAVWGDGTAARDFLYIKDCVDAIMLLAKEGFTGAVNVGTGELTTIRTLAEAVKDATEFAGEIKWDTSMPAGQKQRIMNTDIMSGLGWSPKVAFEDGIRMSVEWFNENRSNISER